MWDNHRMLHGVATGLFIVSGVIIASALAFTLAGLPMFGVRAIQLTGEIRHTTRDQIRTLALSELKGSFFTLDLEQARAAFEKLPWVRRASVRREWPDRLQVFIEEHVALARWRDTALVNTHGEIFEAATSEPLPIFLAPTGTEAEVAEHYENFTRLLAPLGKRPTRVMLSERRAWRVELNDGQLFELGRDLTEERLHRFVSSYPRTIARLPQRPYRVDLRYPNGFAVRAAAAPPRPSRS